MFPITKAEEKLLQDTAKGQVSDFSSGDVSGSEGNSQAWTEDRTIRAEVITYMCSARDNQFEFTSKGIRIKGARIIGVLDFEGMSLTHRLEFLNCLIEQTVILTEAETKTLSFKGSSIVGIEGAGLNLNGSLFINSGFVCNGTINLRDAQIKGGINGEGAILSNEGKEVINGNRLFAGGGLFFSNGFCSTGVITLFEAKVNGSVSFKKATLKNGSNACLDAARISIGGSFVISDGFNCQGTINLTDAQIRGSVEGTGGSLDNEGNEVFKGTRISVAGTLNFSGGFSAIGQVSLFDAKIGSSISFSKATLKNGINTAIAAPRITVAGSVFINDGFSCNGMINLIDAQIKGSIEGSSATLVVEGGELNEVLKAHRISIGGSLNFTDGFSSKGQITLIDAKVGGSISFRKAKLENTGKKTLETSRMSVKGSIFFSEGFVSEGEIILMLTEIGGELVFAEASLKNDVAIALNASSVTVKDSIYFTKGFRSSGIIILNYASVGALIKCRDAHFENPGKTAFEAYELSTGSTVIFANITCVGDTKLVGANINGALEFSNCDYQSTSANTLDLYGIKTGANVLFKEVSLQGCINITCCRIGGNLILHNTKLSNGTQVVLRAIRMEVNGDVELRPKFESKGEIRVDRAKIGNSFYAGGSLLENEGNIAFSGRFLTVGGDVDFSNSTINGDTQIKFAEFKQNFFLSHSKIQNIAAVGLNTKGDVNLQEITVKGGCSLPHAQIGGDLLCKGAKFEMPVVDELTVAKNISNAPNRKSFFDISSSEIRGKLVWTNINLSNESFVIFSSAKIQMLFDDIQSWPQEKHLDLADFCYETINEPYRKVATRIAWVRLQRVFHLQPYEQLIKVLKNLGHDKDAKKIAITRQNDLRKLKKMNWADTFWNWFLNFTIGHGYQIWRVPIFALIIIVIGSIVFHYGMQLGIIVPIKEPKTNYPMFSAIMYSMDVFLPIVDLKQETYWLPAGASNYARFFIVYLWVQILLGWILTTVGLAGLTGIVKRE